MRVASSDGVEVAVHELGGRGPTLLISHATERVMAKERELGSAITFADIAPELAGVYPRIMQQGDMEAGVWSCGMVAGLIRDVPSVQELITRIMAEAESIIASRLAGLLR